MPTEESVTDLMPLDADDLDDADRERLHAAIEESARQFATGEVIDAKESIRRLRA